MDRLVATLPKFDTSTIDLREQIQRLREENQRLRMEADGLRAAAQLVIEEPDSHNLLPSAARQLGRLFQAESAWVVVLADNEIIARGAYVSEGSFPQPPPDIENGLCAAGRCVKGLQAITLPGPRGGFEIAVPIADHQRRLLGVMQANSREPFVAEHIRLAQAFAAIVAVGLERSRLFGRMRDWTQSLEMLFSFHAVINQRGDPGEVVRCLVENAARFLEADGGRTGLAVPTPAGGKVMVSGDYWHRGNWNVRRARWEPGQGIPGFLLDSEFSYISNDYREDRLGDPLLMRDYDVRRALCVPIKHVDETLLGFFEVLRGPGGPAFTWQDAAFLESLANTAATAIHNAQLLKSLEIKSEQIQALSAHHVKRLEAERIHIARELHDEAGQMLIGIKLSLQVLAQTMPGELPQLREELDRLRELVNSSTGQIKELARRLRPPVLDQMGLNVALRQMAVEFTQRTGVASECELEELPARLPADTETALYRIAQEALTNVTRHAGAKRVRFSLKCEGSVMQFRVEDDGAGFDPAATGTGLGLLGIQERADMLGARFAIQTQPGEGTRITVTIPYEAQ